MEKTRQHALSVCLWICLVLLGMMACLQAEAAHAATDKEGVAINETNFPDDAFRSHVGQYDTSKGGKLSGDELQKVTTMSVDAMGIVDLKGIEYFTALLDLHCSNNQLSSLDVSNNSA